VDDIEKGIFLALKRMRDKKLFYVCRIISAF
jgi:hypothetical protein